MRFLQFAVASLSLSLSVQFSFPLWFLELQRSDAVFRRGGNSMFRTFMRLCQNVPSALHVSEKEVSVLCEIVKVTHCRSVAVGSVSAAKGAGLIVKRVTKDTLALLRQLLYSFLPPLQKKCRFTQSYYIHTNGHTIAVCRQ